MKRFTWKILFCVVPIVVAALIVARSVQAYRAGQGGFKLGVDRVGGTMLVYEVDDRSKLPENYKPEELVASLKRRIDPADLYNVTIRAVGRTRVEIILPTGGQHQADAEDAAWKELLEKVKAQWPVPAGGNLDIPVNRTKDLIARVKEQHPDVPNTEIEDFVTTNYQ